jgi:hypothetical protein
LGAKSDTVTEAELLTCWLPIRAATTVGCEVRLPPPAVLRLFSHVVLRLPWSPGLDLLLPCLPVADVRRLAGVVAPSQNRRAPVSPSRMSPSSALSSSLLTSLAPVKLLQPLTHMLLKLPLPKLLSLLRAAGGRAGGEGLRGGRQGVLRSTCMWWLTDRLLGRKGRTETWCCGVAGGVICPLATPTSPGPAYRA